MAARGNYEKGKGPKPEEILRAPRVGTPGDPSANRYMIRYTPEVADKFIEKVLQTGGSPDIACLCEDGSQDPELPCPRTVFYWLAKFPEFSKRYWEAKAAAISHIWAEEIIAIADDKSQDIVWRKAYKGGSPTAEPNGEFMRRSHLRIEARKWLLGKLARNLFGDRVQQEITGKDGGEIRVLTSTVKFVDPA